MEIAPMSEPAPVDKRVDAPPKVSLFSEITRMASVFWRSNERNQLLMLGAGLVVIVIATADRTAPTTGSSRASCIW